MNSLIIVAHPNKNSFSHILINDYRIEKENAWHNVHMIDLYDNERKQDYLMMNDTNRNLDDPLRLKHQKLITQSEEICFFFPLWWFDCPAILKNRFDVNYTNGFAFKYRSGKSTPDKLLNGKKVRVIVTAGWPRWLYNTLGWLIITLPWFFWRIDYVGMKLKSWTWFTDMNFYKTAQSREWMREKVRKLAKR